MRKLKILPVFLAIMTLFTAVSPKAFATDEPNLTAKAAVVADLNYTDGDYIIYAKNMNERRSPASLTKIMTGLLAVEAVEAGRVSLETVVTAGADVRQGLDLDSSNVDIKIGEELTYEDLLHCVMVASANEACNVIASYLEGSIETFVAKMNDKAAELGCKDTHFADPNGLSGMSDNHYSTAYDLYLMTREALSHELFAKVCDTSYYEVLATNMSETRKLNNSNALITGNGIYGGGYLFNKYAHGVKTGYTSAAGYCLVSTAVNEDNGMHLCTVVLGCDGPLNVGDEDCENFVDSKRLYNWAFDNFEYRTVLTAGQALRQVSIEGAEGDGTAVLRPAEDLKLLLPKDTPEDSTSVDVNIFTDRLHAPIEAGAVLGEAMVTVNGNTFRANLITAYSIEINRKAYIRAQILETLSIGWVKLVIGIVVLCLALYIFLTIQYRKKKKQLMYERQLAEERRKAAMKKKEQEELIKKTFNTNTEETQIFTANIETVRPEDRKFGKSDLEEILKSGDWEK